MEDTYIYDELEVKLTGRKAVKKTASGKSVELVEVTPVNEHDGTFRKWTSMNTLFKVQDS
jgi:hypothetical protein